MNLIFVQEAVYLEYNNEYYSDRIKYDVYWNRYLIHFDTVKVVARVKKVEAIPLNFQLSSGSKVQFIPLPYYQGAIGYLKNISQITSIVKEHLFKDHAYVLRIPGVLGMIASKLLKQRCIPYAVEVVGDPYEVISFLPIPFPAKHWLRLYSTRSMQRTIQGAFAALYVTQSVLQARYPAKVGVIKGVASNVIIQESELLIDLNIRKERCVSIPERIKKHDAMPVRIGVVGMLYNIKSPIEIVHAVNLLIQQGLNLEVNFVGEGPLTQEVNKLAASLNISEKIICIGKLPNGKAIFDFLDSIDLYLQFSKTEGLPRALLEALARGCPAIASGVGGIPEVIADDLLVKSGDVKALARKIASFSQDVHRMQKAVDENVHTASRFTDAELRKKRENFYSAVYNYYQNINQREDVTKGSLL